MTQIYTTIQIQTPIQRVFDYVTTPGNWPVWHPSSLGVSGATSMPSLPVPPGDWFYRLADSSGLGVG